jgi:hypothetical protein
MGVIQSCVELSKFDGKIGPRPSRAQRVRRNRVADEFEPRSRRVVVAGGPPAARPIARD